VSTALDSSLSGRAAITGIGATEFSKDSGRSELRLAAEAVKAAIADAGLTPKDVDGLVTFTQDNNHEAAVAREVGIPSLSFFSRVNYGGGAACATVLHAAMAVATGVAKHVVCYRAFNERSGQRYGQVQTGLGALPTSGGVDYGWSYPFGLSTPAGWVAMIAQRYLHAYGATSEDFGRISVIDRKHAATNPKAFFYGKPITLADHQASRWIVEPLHLLDCCLVSNGAVAVIVTAADRARDLRQPPVHLLGFGQAAPGDNQRAGREPGVHTGAGRSGELALGMAGVALEDIDVLELYDCYTYTVLVTLEDYGFCAKGEGGPFVSDGKLGPGGSLPCNTGGGQLSSYYMWGFTPLSEGVIQARGQAGERQVPRHDHVLVSGNGGVLNFHSTTILSPLAG
jgi:acetyl-CoA acetyltransferase